MEQIETYNSIKSDHSEAASNVICVDDLVDNTRGIHIFKLYGEMMLKPITSCHAVNYYCECCMRICINRHRQKGKKWFFLFWTLKVIDKFIKETAM